MEKKMAEWGFKSQKRTVTIRDFLEIIKVNLNKNDEREVIHLGHGDPSPYPSFRTSPVAEESLINALRSTHFNGYPPAPGVSAARRAIAKHLSDDLPYKLSEEDVFLTAGANHAIEVILTVLARPGANILFPRPGYPVYEARAAFSNLEVRHFNLLPERAWEVDLDGVEALADDKTIAMVVINPGNPCGNVFTLEHMQKIAETAKRLGILLITDEVYNHIVFGSNKYIPMGILGSVTPILTVGSMSKRWLIPGWRLGWIVASDPNGVLNKSGIIESVLNYLCITADPATLIQGAVPEILEKSTKEFFLKTNDTLRESADACYATISEIPSLSCPHKPEGAMSTMIEINPSLLGDVKDDMDFALKIAREESVVIMPGTILGLKNWLRLSFSVEPAALRDGLERIKAFCSRHSNNYKN
ncbi:Tyrosine transaminase family protein [Perilla frutescens var. hirtella]|uniref:Tyrosine transaminase family protein n=1 Tax=Perilla frutescens var. hirtella TaxID=608512 RepID=A0AAD4JIW0_PERFH|nr:Tyrosine transaminase family protein [Perilla frutescens var. hirtella]KAH6833913.1 Tyrosine transaminase family protein [Perilla frutescens var. hirtella]